MFFGYLWVSDGSPADYAAIIRFQTTERQRPLCASRNLRRRRRAVAEEADEPVADQDFRINHDPVDQLGGTGLALCVASQWKTRRCGDRRVYFFERRSLIGAA